MAPHANACTVPHTALVSCLLIGVAVLATLPISAVGQVRTCSAVTTPAGLIGGEYGAIHSDVDGYRGSDAMQYYHASSEDCRWQIKCPAGSTFFSYSFVAHLGASANITLWDPAGSVAYTVASISSSTQELPPQEGMVDLLSIAGGRVTIGFVSASGDDPGLGFTLNFRCLATQCSSSLAGSTQTAVSGEIQTDTDGSGPVHYQAGEKCKWRVECPEGHQEAVMFRISGDTGATPLQLVPDGEAGWSGVMAGDTSVTFRKSTNVSISLLPTGAPAAGVTVKWECRASLCTERLPSAELGLDYFQQAYQLDGNEYSSLLFLAPTSISSSCQQTISCPSSTEYLVTSGWAKLRAGASLKIGDGPLHVGPADVDLLDMLDFKQGVAVQFDTGGWGTNDTFGLQFSMAYTCQRTQCLSHTPTHSSMVFTASRFSINALPVSRNLTSKGGNACEWTIRDAQCRDIHFLRVQGNTLITKSNASSVTELSTGKVLAVDPAPHNSHGVFLPSTKKVRISYSTTSFPSTSRERWSFNISCVRPCDSNYRKNCYDSHADQFIVPPQEYVPSAAAPMESCIFSGAIAVVLLAML